MILIVDDDDANRDSLRILLECEGYSVADFASGREFLDAAPTLAGSCLILDLHMPGVTGLQVLDALHIAKTPLPVIIVTGNPSPAECSRALAAGAIAVLEKPFEQSALMTCIKRALI